MEGTGSSYATLKAGDFSLVNSFYCSAGFIMKAFRLDVEKIANQRVSNERRTFLSVADSLVKLDKSTKGKGTNARTNNKNQRIGGELVLGSRSSK